MYIKVKLHVPRYPAWYAWASILVLVLAFMHIYNAYAFPEELIFSSSGNAGAVPAPLIYTNPDITDNILTAALMGLYGCICAFGAVLGSWIEVKPAGEAEDPAPRPRAVCRRAAAGFLLGGFGGLAALELLKEHNVYNLSTPALAGCVALVISLFSSSVIDVLKILVTKYLKK